MKSLRNSKVGKNIGGTIDEGQFAGAIHRYDGMSEDALTGEFMRRLTEGKLSGTLDMAGVNKAVANLLPHLNNAQKDKLNKLLKNLE